MCEGHEKKAHYEGISHLLDMFLCVHLSVILLVKRGSFSKSSPIWPVFTKKAYTHLNTF